MTDNCGRLELFARYSQKFDISMFDKSDAFPACYYGFWPGKVQLQYKQKFELTEFDITRFDYLCFLEIGMILLFAVYINIDEFCSL